MPVMSSSREAELSQETGAWGGSQGLLGCDEISGGIHKLP